MSQETAEWLARQREKRGWSRVEMAKELIKAGTARGVKSLPDPDNLKGNIYRWEKGTGVSHLYVTLYCDVFDIPYTEFPRQRRSRSKPKAGTNLAVPEAGHMTYRGNRAPGKGDATVEHEVMMAAHESSDHAAEHEQQGIGDITFEQLRADVIRLSRQTDSGSPLPVFTDLRRVRDRIYRLLDRNLWPSEQSDLYFLLGCVNGLMGMNANRLGYPDAAEELIRAGWAYANAIDHRPLQGRLRAQLSYVMYWRGWFRESSDLAVDGLRYTADGHHAADLYLNHARAAARLGEPDTARQAVRHAYAARESEYSDDLVEISGENFAPSWACIYSMAGGALAEITGGAAEANDELERALSAFDEGLTHGERHWFGGRALASTRLALVRMNSADLDGTAAALQTVLILPPSQRVSSLTSYLARIRAGLAAHSFQGSAQARDLGDQIEAFSREAVTASLHSLTG